MDLHALIHNSALLSDEEKARYIALTKFLPEEKKRQLAEILARESVAVSAKEKFKQVKTVEIDRHTAEKLVETKYVESAKATKKYNKQKRSNV